MENQYRYNILKLNFLFKIHLLRDFLPETFGYLYTCSYIIIAFFRCTNILYIWNTNIQYLLPILKYVCNKINLREIAIHL